MPATPRVHLLVSIAGSAWNVMVLPARRLLILSWMWLAFAPRLAAGAEDWASVRQAFLDAMAVASISPTPAPGDPDALRQYVLYPYLQAARLRTELALLTPASTSLTVPTLPLDDRIATFLASQGTRPVVRRLRDDWLTSLATRRAWSTLLAQFDPQRDTQPTIRCQALAARIALGRTDGIVDDLKSLWLTPRTLPDACDAGLDWWRYRDGPGAELTEQRARLALAAGEASLGRSLARTLPAARAAPLLQWAGLIDQPAREVAAVIADPGRAVLDEALKDGWMRFARADPDAASQAYPELVRSRQLDTRAASPYALGLALALSWNRKPGALDFFERVQTEDFDERAHEWRARAALWAGDWQQAREAIAAMPDTLRQQARWQ
jgi:soluble lytic murein transglycosylase